MLAVILSTNAFSLSLPNASIKIGVYDMSRIPPVSHPLLRSFSKRLVQSSIHGNLIDLRVSLQHWQMLEIAPTVLTHCKISFPLRLEYVVK